MDPRIQGVKKAPDPDPQHRCKHCNNDPQRDFFCSRCANSKIEFSIRFIKENNARVQPQKGRRRFVSICCTHRLNMDLDLQSLFVHSCTHWLRTSNPLPSHLGSYTRALLVSQDKRHLFVTSWLYRGENSFLQPRATSATETSPPHNDIFLKDMLESDLNP
jgi:hypothetical protein